MRLTKNLNAFLIFVVFLAGKGVGVYAYSLTQMNAVLNPANLIFTYMENRNYKGIWSLLSKDSKDSIISSICKISKEKFHQECNKSVLLRSFKNGSGAAISYWNSYLRYFNPETVLKESRWGIKYINSKNAELSIKYKKAPKPFYLKLIRENGKWKVRLIESIFRRY